MTAERKSGIILGILTAIEGGWVVMEPADQRLALRSLPRLRPRYGRQSSRMGRFALWRLSLSLL